MFICEVEHSAYILVTNVGNHVRNDLPQVGTISQILTSRLFYSGQTCHLLLLISEKQTKQRFLIFLSCLLPLVMFSCQHPRTIH